MNEDEAPSLTQKSSSLSFSFFARKDCFCVPEPCFFFLHILFLLRRIAFSLLTTFFGGEGMGGESPSGEDLQKKNDATLRQHISNTTLVVQP